jgi:hypothetical protein
VSANGIWIHIKRRGVCHVSAGGVRYDRDVIAYFVILRKACLGVERIAHRDIRRPSRTSVRAPGIKELRVDVIGSIARIVPDGVDPPGRRD